MKILSGNSWWSISDTEVPPKASLHRGPLSLTLGFQSPGSADGATWIKNSSPQTDPESLSPELLRSFVEWLSGAEVAGMSRGGLVFPRPQNLQSAWH